jgi:hypothetical protein
VFRGWTLRAIHTRDWEPVTITLQELSLVEKAELVQVHFSLRLRDQRSTWMQDGCKVDMDSYMASNGSCFKVTWIVFNIHLLEVGLIQRAGGHATLNTHNYWFNLLYHVWGPTWIEIRWNSIWLRVHSHMTSHYTWWSMTTLHDFGSCVKWPLLLNCKVRMPYSVIYLNKNTYTWVVCG